MILEIIYAIFVISGMGILFGLGLGYAGKRFAVPEDERVSNIRGILPGANCGGCGFAGCDQLAGAIASGNAECNACPVGGSALALQIAEIMGVDAKAVTAATAYIKCAGDSSKATYRYEYIGLDDCRSAAFLPGGGSKSCQFGCLGMGSCAGVCNYGAITVSDGIAFVDPDKCTACGMCVKVCPRNLIDMVPADKTVRVACNSRDNGKAVRSYCQVGCISCKMCEKACAYDAIHVDGMLACVDYEKCTLCGECVAKCPTNAIVRD